jgi:hydrogenase nickel incorporation protein HypB
MMCTTCGCGHADVTVEGEKGHHHHHHDHDHDHGHHHDHYAHAPGVSEARIVEIERDILSKNDHIAWHNRDDFTRAGILALNLVSSPGSGKTTLLARTAAEIGKRRPVAVIEGDQQTSLDADRIRASGARAVQVNTGKGCHLDASMVSRAIAQIEPEPGSVLFIENVGNLVCPAAFDLGEAAKVVILSVTEGEDKPLKYPDMFRASKLMVLNKADLLPYVPFDIAKCVEYARRVNPGIEVIELSALTGEGLDAWYSWIGSQAAELQVPAKAGE